MASNRSLTFSPSTAGLKQATLRLLSDDADEGTIDILLTGNGVDSSAPNTTVSGRALSNLAESIVYFDGTDDVNDGLTLTYEVALNGGAFAPSSNPGVFPGLADGTHTLLVRATDSAGNVDPTPASFTWVRDTTLPQIDGTFSPLAILTTQLLPDYRSQAVATDVHGPIVLTQSPEAGQFLAAGLNDIYIQGWR